MTIGQNLPQPTAVPPGAGLAGKAPGVRPELLSGAAVRVTSGASSDVGGVDPAVEGDLRRDDEIGMLFTEAFNLPPPELNLEPKD